jgi:hypothetical protein
MEFVMQFNQITEIVDYFNDYIDNDHGVSIINENFKEDHNIDEDEYIFDVIKNSNEMMIAYYNAVVDEINNYDHDVNDQAIKVFNKV